MGFNDSLYHEGNLSKMPDFDNISLLELQKRTDRSHGIEKMKILNAKVVFKSKLIVLLEI